MDTATKVAILVPVYKRVFNQLILLVEEPLSWASFYAYPAFKKFYFIAVAIDIVDGMPRHVAVSALRISRWIKIQHRCWKSLDVVLVEHCYQRFERFAEALVVD